MNFLVLSIFVVIAILANVNLAFHMGTSRIAHSSLSMANKKIESAYRKQISQQKRMQDQYKKYQSAKKKDVPYFQLAIRPKAGGQWIPFSEFVGDARALSIVNAYTSGFLTNFYKNTMDQSVARSLFSQGDEELSKMIEEMKLNVQSYPYKKFPFEEMDFGYKVDFKPVEDKMGPQNFVVLKRPEQKGWFDNIKETFSLVFSSPEEVKEKEVKKDTGGINEVSAIFKQYEK